MPTPYRHGWDPPPIISGMVNIELDGLGRLWSFDAVPPQVEETAVQLAARFDWRALFTAAGLDPARFTPSDPRWLPLTAFDARAAWNGSYPDTPQIPVRIEAAAWHGKPVYFQMVLPWTRPARSQPYQMSAGQQAVNWLVIGAICVLFAVAAALAWRSARQGKGDLRGASRVAALIFVCSLFVWICSAHHVPTFAEFFKLIWALSSALFSATAYWVLYVALEPYARRRWPQSLIAWTRLLSGRIRDPLVGGHVLAGIAVGMGMSLLLALRALVIPVSYVNLLPFQGVRSAAGVLAQLLPDEILPSLFVFLLFFLLRALLRRQWLAVGVFLLLCSLLSVQEPHPLIAVAFQLPLFGTALLVLIRLGLLSLVAALIVADVFAFPLTINLSAWYAGYGIVPLIVVLGSAIWAFRTALAGRPLFREGFLES